MRILASRYSFLTPHTVRTNHGFDTIGPFFPLLLYMPKPLSVYRWIFLIVLFLYLALLTKNILFKKGGFRYYKHYFNSEYRHYSVKKGWAKANTVPFRTINLYKKGLERNNLTAEYNIWGNLIGFVPLGILLPLAIPFFRRWWIMLPAGLLVSLGYETAQLLTGLGVWDVDDLLLNTGGATAGYILFVMGASIWNLIYPRK